MLDRPCVRYDLTSIRDSQPRSGPTETDRYGTGSSRTDCPTVSLGPIAVLWPLSCYIICEILKFRLTFGLCSMTVCGVLSLSLIPFKILCVLVQTTDRSSPWTREIGRSKLVLNWSEIGSVQVSRSSPMPVTVVMGLITNFDPAQLNWDIAFMKSAGDLSVSDVERISRL